MSVRKVGETQPQPEEGGSAQTSQSIRISKSAEDTDKKVVHSCAVRGLKFLWVSINVTMRLKILNFVFYKIYPFSVSFCSYVFLSY